ncbi:MAG: GNAT family N-acetyltransferase [Gammaproteobacteria bacterium]|nr:GNAT family N-acetyltransferase [Gammaproteobacteria bacterium]
MDFKIETERLNIVPLDLVAFELFVADMQAMERSLGLVADGKNLEGHVKSAMEGLLKMAKADLKNLQWLTSWQIILTAEKRAIGSACFMGPANAEGAVEVGYGINEAYRGCGYMTEAIAVLSDWALTQDDVRSITAKTDKDNPASWRVLEKAGLVKIGEDDEYFSWGKSG